MRRAPHITNEYQWQFHHTLRVHFETGLGPIPPLVGTPAEGVVPAPGGGLAGQLVAQDANGTYWEFNVTDTGVWESAPFPGQILPITPYTFIDIALTPYQNVRYSLGITTAGVPYAIPLSGPPGPFIRRLPLLTSGSGLQTYLSVQFDQLVIDPPAQVTRPPEVMLRFSSDGGHTWSNIYTRGAGFAGQFRKVVEWRRLGRARSSRVYEVSVTDPIPWRIVDAYLDMTDPTGQGYKPVERYANQLRKMT
jgi:hypothetical protein